MQKALLTILACIGIGLIAASVYLFGPAVIVGVIGCVLTAVAVYLWLDTTMQQEYEEQAASRIYASEQFAKGEIKALQHEHVSQVIQLSQENGRTKAQLESVEDKFKRMTTRKRGPRGFVRDESAAVLTIEGKADG